MVPQSRARWPVFDSIPVRTALSIGAIAALAWSTWVQAAATTESPIGAAVKRGDVATVRALLRGGADVNAPEGDGMTPLHWAATSGDATIARELVAAGARANAATTLARFTPLHVAVTSDSSAVVQVLLSAGADIAATTAAGTTPLMLAARSGQVAIAALLLDAGADVNAREAYKGHTALMFAAEAGRAEAIALLLSRGADPTTASRVIDVTAVAGRGRNAPAPGAAPQIAGIDRRYNANELVGAVGGLTPLLFAARQGHRRAVEVLIERGVDVNQRSGADRTSVLLLAIINGHFDLAMWLLERGADPRLAADNGATPLYGAINLQWAPKAFYPQPRAHLQQHTTYLELMRALLDQGADPNARVKKKIWYTSYNADNSGVDETGATPFWRAAYASDVDAMRLLIARGADPLIPTAKPAGRPQTGDADDRDVIADLSGLPPLPVGGPAVTPLQAASGVGYGEGYAGNSHRHHPAGWMPAVKYLVEELGADVNARDHEGNTALHHAAARGDSEMILYFVSKGADVRAVNREGNTVADMANGPVQRIQPFPETLALLMKLGSKNNHRCVSC